MSLLRFIYFVSCFFIISGDEVIVTLLKIITFTCWRYRNRERQQERAVLQQGINAPGSISSSSESLPPALEVKGKLYRPSSGDEDVHSFILPPNTAGMAQLKRKHIIPPSVPLQQQTSSPSFSLAPSLPVQSLLPPQHSAATNRPLQPAQSTAILSQTFLSAQHAAPTLHRLLPAQSTVPLAQPPLPSHSTVLITTPPLPQVPTLPLHSTSSSSSLVQVSQSVDVSYTTQWSRKKKLKEEQKQGRKKRKYVRKSSSTICHKCEQERDPATHHQYFGNWYCQATAQIPFEEWKKAPEERGYGKKYAAD